MGKAELEKILLEGSTTSSRTSMDYNEYLSDLLGQGCGDLSSPVPLYPNESYNVALIDESLTFPYLISRELAQTAKEIMDPYPTSFQKGRALFFWFLEHIPYDREKDGVYRNSLETFEDMTGVCGESANLYVSMARAGGVGAYYANVDVDAYENEVCHACAALVYGENIIFVDPAYREFDIRHKSVEVLCDRAALIHHEYARSKGRLTLNDLG